MILTAHWQWMSFGTWPWVKGQSRNPSDTGMTPAADCEGNWPVAHGWSLDWPGTPEDCDPPTAHSQHQNWGKRNRKKDEQLTLDNVLTFNLPFLHSFQINCTQWRHTFNTHPVPKANSTEGHWDLLR